MGRIIGGLLWACFGIFCFGYMAIHLSAGLQKGYFPAKHDQRVARGTPRYPVFIGFHILGLGMGVFAVLQGTYWALKPKPPEI